MEDRNMSMLVKTRGRKDSASGGKGFYDGEWVDGIPHGNGVLVDKSGNRFEGIFLSGKRVDGRTAFVNGDVHIGAYINNVRHGPNHLYAFWNGDRYEGEMKNGRIEGKGKFKWASGDIYVGELINGVAHGDGTKYLKNGDRYAGQWKNGQAWGWGTKTFANKDIHQGTYKCNKRNGYGTYTWSNGDLFKGYYKDGKATGMGKKVTGVGKNKVVQNGMFVDGQLEGNGRVNFVDAGITITGYFSAGRRKGPCTICWADGASLHGVFDDDVLVEGIMRNSNGSTFEGQFERGQAHGLGTQCFENGDSFQGYFENNKRNSKGIYTWHHNGLQYRGEWKDGKEHGAGKIFDASGNVLVVGQFRNGKLVEDKSLSLGDMICKPVVKNGTKHSWDSLSMLLRDNLLWNVGAGDNIHVFAHKI